MLKQTTGLILHSFKYGDTSVISHIYTKDFGRQSFIIKGARGKKSKNKANILQPLMPIVLTTNFNPKREIQFIQNISSAFPLHSIPFEQNKRSIIIFLSEFLYHYLKEENANPDLFDFCYHAIEFFDVNDEGINNFHYVFLHRASQYFGFFPHNNYSEKKQVFDLLNGTFSLVPPMHGHYASKEISAQLHKLFNVNFKNIAQLKLTNRTEILETLIEYYQLHLDGKKELKSLQILKEIYR